MRLILALSLSLYFSLFTIARTNRSRLCVDEDAGLQWLSSRLSEDSTITCRQNRQTADSTGRYWAAQLVNDASVVVTPASSEDVSLAVQATMKTPLGRDYAFVSGGHSLTGASSSRGLVIDLERLNHTTVLHNFTDPMTQRGTTVVMYEGGVTSFGLQSAVNGTGWTAVTPRASSVGMGGFSTGGGIGFMANAYGYAIDRLVALEVVLPSGETVIATKKKQTFRSLLGDPRWIRAVRYSHQVLSKGFPHPEKRQGWLSRRRQWLCDTELPQHRGVLRAAHRSFQPDVLRPGISPDRLAARKGRRDGIPSHSTDGDVAVSGSSQTRLFPQN